MKIFFFNKKSSCFLQTCQKLVMIQPCSSHSLYLLGLAQFAEFENSSGDSANKMLDESIASYEGCIGMEGKPMSGDPPAQLTGE